MLECDSANSIWNDTVKLTKKLEPAIGRELDRIKQMFAAVNGTNPTIISVHAEVQMTIIRLKDSQKWLLHTKALVKNLILSLMNPEKVKEK